MKIGFFGGAFDPFHLGHLEMAKAAWDQLKLDRILLVPTYSPAHKAKSQFSYEDRIHMLEQATKHLPWLEVSRLESELPQPSFTYRSLVSLHDSYEAQRTPLELTLIIGGDSFQSFKCWHEWQKIERLCKIAVFPRQNAEKEQLSAQEYQLDTDVIWLETPGWPYSSTAIRDVLKDQGCLEDMVPIAVSEWIKEHQQLSKN